MADDTQSLKFSQYVESPLVHTYNAFTSSVALQSWFADFAEVVPNKDGRFYAWWNTVYFTSGIFTEVKENELITFTWRGLAEPHPSKVHILFEEQGDGTLVTVRHSQIGNSDEWRTHIKEFTKGWETCLDNLKSVLETGIDKRIYERPMLGIKVNQILNQEEAHDLGLPVDYGVSLADTLEGMGAKEAGLQGGDIVVSLDGTELKSFQDFNSALSGRKAGDTVEVIYYREGDEHSVQMTLSGRPIPEIPDSAEALSDKIAETYAQTDDELDSLFEGVNESEASFRPEPEEWSAKEVLAHLIYNERWLHLAITAAIGNYRPGGYTNDLGMHAAIANAYNLDELITEFKNCEAITINAVAALPDEFVADKRSFAPLATLLGEQGLILHTRAHLPQMRAAIEAARA